MNLSPAPGAEINLLISPVWGMRRLIYLEDCEEVQWAHWEGLHGRFRRCRMAQVESCSSETMVRSIFFLCFFSWLAVTAAGSDLASSETEKTRERLQEILQAIPATETQLHQLTCRHVQQESGIDVCQQ